MGVAVQRERVTPKHIKVHEGIPLTTISRTTYPTAGNVTQYWREQWQFTCLWEETPQVMVS